MRILWSPLATDRVAEIAEYIAVDNPIAAENWVNTVFKKVEELKKLPKLAGSFRKCTTRA